MDSADGDNVYKVTVTVFDGVASKSQAVSVTVDERRRVREREPDAACTPQTGRAITASLSDPGRRCNGRRVAVVQGRPGYGCCRPPNTG